MSHLDESRPSEPAVGLSGTELGALLDLLKKALNNPSPRSDSDTMVSEVNETPYTSVLEVDPKSKFPSD